MKFKLLCYQSYSWSEDIDKEIPKEIFIEDVKEIKSYGDMCGDSEINITLHDDEVIVCNHIKVRAR